MSIHLSRHEYRTEYLRSEHWLRFRSGIISIYPNCQKCSTRPSSQIHHCHYRSLYEENERDVLALCSPCHKLIEMAKSFKLLPTHHDQSAALRITREQIDALRRKVSALSEWQAHRIQRTSLFIQRRITGNLKLPSFPSDWRKLIGMKLTARKYWFIQMALSGKLSGPPRRKKLQGNIGRIRVHY